MAKDRYQGGSAILDELADAKQEVPKINELDTRSLMRVGIVQACLHGHIERWNLAGRMANKRTLVKTVLLDTLAMLETLDELIPPPDKVAKPNA